MILSIIKRDLTTIWVGSSSFCCLILISGYIIISCNLNKDKWRLPNDLVLIDEVIDSIVYSQQEKKPNLIRDGDFLIKISENYTLKGNLINGQKIGWWTFNGLNDSLKIEFIEIDSKPFKNQVIYYSGKNINRELSKFYKIQKHSYTGDTLLYKIYFYVPELSNEVKDYKINYGIVKNNKVLLRKESFGEVKDSAILYKILLPTHNDSIILKAMLSQEVYSKHLGGFILNQSFLSQTLN